MNETIYSSPPIDWKDLQLKVAVIFDDMGCKSYVEKEIETLRGKVTVDVYVEDIAKIPSSVYLCECKYWERSIPQTVVHAFRTVVSDYGAHHGIIISKKGFQTGAYEAKTHTNVRIMTWMEFQEELYPRWIDAMIEKVKLASEAMLSAADNEDDKRQKIISMLNHNEREKYKNLSVRALTFSGGLLGTMPGVKEIQFPLRTVDYSISGVRDVIVFQSKKDFLDFVISRAKSLTAEFEAIFNNVAPRSDELSG